MEYREITIEDYPKLISFWKKEYLVTKLDEFKRVELFLEKNSGLSILAEENDIILGTALGSFDGRRGSLQKVVVSKNYRRKGLGQFLVKEVIKRLHSIGAVDIRFNTAEELVSFYEKCGFKKDTRPSMILKSF